MGQAEKKTISNFGDWRIDQVDVNKSYMLIGSGEVKGDLHRFLGFRYFWIQCFEGFDKLSITIPYDKKPEFKTTQPAMPVSVWSDRAKPRELLFLMMNPAILIVMSGREGEIGWAAKEFIEVLLTAEKTFALGFEEKSLHFDMSDFKAAWSKFSQVCTR
jgi:hypothetical protein